MMLFGAMESENFVGQCDVCICFINNLQIFLFPINNSVILKFKFLSTRRYAN